MARTREIELFSMSFLDLIFCAMAGVLVLYVIADPPLPGATEESKPPRQLSVELPNNFREFAFGFELQAPGRLMRGSMSGSPGPWTIVNKVPADFVATLLIDQDVDGPMTFRLFVEDARFGTPLPSEIKARTQYIDLNALTITPADLTLNAGNMYAAEITIQ